MRHLSLDLRSAAAKASSLPWRSSQCKLSPLVVISQAAPARDSLAVGRRPILHHQSMPMLPTNFE
jgi:hypothetical protein